MLKTALKILAVSGFVLTVGVMFYYNKYPAYFGQEIMVEKESQLAEVANVIEPKKLITILNFGDLMLGRNVAKIMGNTGASPFETIMNQEENLFENVDLLVANLEGPITDTEVCQNKPYSFKFKPETANLLKDTGFDLFSIANNHAFDCFQKGFDDTQKYLSQSGIGYFGVNDLEKSFVVKEVQDKKIAFASIDLSIPIVSLKKFYLKVVELKEKNDYVIVDIHWGSEYELENSEEQSAIGKNLIDSGADVVFGHHPHVVQPVEIYKNKPIFYSLGNFVFDQIDPETNIGMGVKVSIDTEKEKINFKIYPFDIVNTHPIFMTEESASEFCRNILKGRIKYYDKCSFGLLDNFD